MTHPTLDRLSVAETLAARHFAHIVRSQVRYGCPGEITDWDIDVDARVREARADLHDELRWGGLR